MTNARPAPAQAVMKPALHRLDLAAFAVTIVFLLSGLLTLGNYGLSWDEGLGNFFFGNRYAQYITTFDPTYLDFAKTLPEDQPGMLQLEQYTPFRDRPYEFPGLIDTLSASFMRLFAYQLHTADPVDAFHSFTIVLAALYLLLQYLYVTRLLNRPAAFISILLLATYPRFWGDMHFNPKDVPEAALFALALMSFAVWARKPGWGDALLTGVYTGLALGVKANALFLPVVMLVWLAMWLFAGRQGLADLLALARNWAQVLAMGVSAGLAYWLSWPLLYAHPGLARLYFQYIFDQGGRQAKGEWTWQPLRMAVSVSPEIFLIALGMGLVAALVWLVRGGERGRLAAFLLAWLAIPIVRISAPISVNFDGIRHYLEFLPAATILGGVGVTATISWLRTRHVLLNTALVAFLASYFLANIIQAHSLYHPYQYIYYNQITGGTEAAQKIFKQSEVTDYWAVSYRGGLDWINSHAEPNSLLYVPIGDYLVSIPANIWLRDDIKQVSADQLGSLVANGKKVYMMHITRPTFYKGAAKACEGTKPIYQYWVGGVPVLQIFDLADCPPTAVQ